MKRREAIALLWASALLVFALLTAFAIELSDTQAKSKRDVEARVHERAVLAAALIDSLFQTVQQSTPQYERLYGTSKVSNRTMDAQQQRNAYLALLDSSGRVIAYSAGFTAQARADLLSSKSVQIVRAGHPYGLGNVLPYGRTGAIDFAVAVPTRFGTRIVLQGIDPGTLSAFISGDLRKIPGVAGAHNYALDGNGRVLASTNPARPAGYVFRTPGQLEVLRHPSGDVQGHYYDKVALANSTWQIVLGAPTGPLFATVSGLRKWVPWLIFVAFALGACAALMLGLRSLRSAAEVREANLRLEELNRELAETNDELARRARELARSNADLDQFASIASHDLQEPLRKVRTFTDRLTVMESDRISEKGREYLERANAAAARMQTLIEDLLKFSRVATQGRRFAPVDLERVAHEVVGDLEAQVADSGAVVRIGSLPTISADEPQMRQLLQNLLSNAVKFRRDDVVPEIDISARVENGTVTIVVTDNGIGFDPQYSRRIFRVFERLHGAGAYPGTGIGLALCRKIAERHGGTVVADSVPGIGSTFTVMMEIDRQEAVLALPADASDESSGEGERAYAAV